MAGMAATARPPCRRRAPVALRRVMGSESRSFSISFRISKSGGLVILMSIFFDEENRARAISSVLYRRTREVIFAFTSWLVGWVRWGVCDGSLHSKACERLLPRAYGEREMGGFSGGNF
jgi:hypothetical protein